MTFKIIHDSPIASLLNAIVRSVVQQLTRI